MRPQNCSFKQSLTVWEDLQNTAQMYTQRAKVEQFILAAVMSWRRCVSLWKRKYFVWASKRRLN